MGGALHFFMTEASNAEYGSCPPAEVECIILSVNDTYMDAQEVMHMTDYSKITALYSRLSVGDEDRDGGESNSIQNQKTNFWRTMPEGST